MSYDKPFLSIALHLLNMMLNLFILFARPKPDPARKLGSPIHQKTLLPKKKNQEVNRSKLVNRKTSILKQLLMIRPLTANILTNPQMLSLPPLMLNRQNQTGLIQ